METGEGSQQTPCMAAEESAESSTYSPYLFVPASPFMKKLYQGPVVSVYLLKRSPWAVKKVNKQFKEFTESFYEMRLEKEAKILQNLQHPNIVGYRGLTKTKDGSLCLAMEYGGEKSLNDLIEERSEKKLGPFPAHTILKVALSMARGLKYLHNDKKILHGDIKSKNVVIKGDFESIKICEVGLSRPLDENMILSDPQVYYIGTKSWSSKEALANYGVTTDKSDIFAFGLTLWEMMTLSIPHVKVSPEGVKIDDLKALGTRPPLNADELDDSYQRVIELFKMCSSEDPKERPSAALIVETLEAENIQ
ncbi:lymphokine-activated killer T-cell-originated protein kinase-like isoform 2-T2 [Anomaloglossus baeobatrachus]|uniref:lymphokine-activated killer T-cell-originated protein kinase-like isoform X1 n=2 Tax=Anomaloglossus baeobatrachus TaxID=238106 RepID=UPI003F4F9EEE